MDDFFISADDLWQSMARPGHPRVLDVRRPEAIEQGSRFIPGSRWRDHLKTSEWGDAFHAKSLVLTCMHGHNVSQLAASALRARGIDARVLAGGVEGWLAGGLPCAGQSELTPMAAIGPTRWVTRINPKIDRIACPWLIRRFIDPDGEFFFVEPEWVLDVATEMGAVAFDTPGATIEHDGPLCSFDTLLRAFAIDDPALHQLALIVRGADTDHNELAPEAAGLLAVSIGNALVARSDHHALDLGFPVYDALYARLRLAAEERHGWAPMRT